MLLPVKQEGKRVQIVLSYIDNYEVKVYLTHTVKVASTTSYLLG